MNLTRIAATILVGLGLGMAAPAVALGLATPSTSIAASPVGVASSPMSGSPASGASCRGQSCASTDGHASGQLGATASATAVAGSTAGGATQLPNDDVLLAGEALASTVASSEDSERIPIDRDSLIVLAVFASVIAAAFAGFTFANVRWTDA